MRSSFRRRHAPQAQPRGTRNVTGRGTRNVNGLSRLLQGAAGARMTGHSPGTVVPEPRVRLWERDSTFVHGAAAESKRSAELKRNGQSTGFGRKSHLQGNTTPSRAHTSHAVEVISGLDSPGFVSALAATTVPGHSPPPEEYAHSTGRVQQAHARKSHQHRTHTSHTMDRPSTDHRRAGPHSSEPMPGSGPVSVPASDLSWYGPPPLLHAGSPPAPARAHARHNQTAHRRTADIARASGADVASPTHRAHSGGTPSARRVHGSAAVAVLGCDDSPKVHSADATTHVENTTAVETAENDDTGTDRSGDGQGGPAGTASAWFRNDALMSEALMSEALTRSPKGNSTHTKTPVASEPTDNECSICLSEMNDRARLDCCRHVFCSSCILSWCKINNNCPMCKRTVLSITRADPGRPAVTKVLSECKLLGVCLVRELAGDRDLVLIPSVTTDHEQQRHRMWPQHLYEEAMRHVERIACFVCSGGQDPARLLLCDGCNVPYHTYCLNPPLTAVPSGDWFCPVCAQRSVATLSQDANSTLQLLASSQDTEQEPVEPPRALRRRSARRVIADSDSSDAEGSPGRARRSPRRSSRGTATASDQRDYSGVLQAVGAGVGATRRIPAAAVAVSTERKSPVRSTDGPSQSMSPSYPASRRSADVHNHPLTVYLPEVEVRRGDAIISSTLRQLRDRARARGDRGPTRRRRLRRGAVSTATEPADQGGEGGGGMVTLDADSGSSGVESVPTRSQSTDLSGFLEDRTPSQRPLLSSSESFHYTSSDESSSSTSDSDESSSELSSEPHPGPRVKRRNVSSGSGRSVSGVSSPPAAASISSSEVAVSGRRSYGNAGRVHGSVQQQSQASAAVDSSPYFRSPPAQASASQQWISVRGAKKPAGTAPRSTANRAHASQGSLPPGRSPITADQGTRYPVATARRPSVSPRNTNLQRRRNVGSPLSSSSAFGSPQTERKANEVRTSSTSPLLQFFPPALTYTPYARVQRKSVVQKTVTRQGKRRRKGRRRTKTRSRTVSYFVISGSVPAGPLFPSRQRRMISNYVENLGPSWWKHPGARNLKYPAVGEVITKKLPNGTTRRYRILSDGEIMDTGMVRVRASEEKRLELSTRYGVIRLLYYLKLKPSNRTQTSYTPLSPSSRRTIGNLLQNRMNRPLHQT